MKKFLSSLFGKPKRTEQDPPAAPLVQGIDPGSIRFSMPTISNDMPPMEAAARAPGSRDLLMHEDEWCQTEFHPQQSVPELQRMLREYKAFEAAHRTPHGWTKVYVRELARHPPLTEGDPAAHLATLLDGAVGPAPYLHTTSALVGSVANGFHVNIGGGVSLYGFVEGGCVSVLGATVIEGGDETGLTDAFARLHRSHRLVLVDWRTQLLLLDVDQAGDVTVWRP
jgi:hypothetical protein